MAEEGGRVGRRECRKGEVQRIIDGERDRILVRERERERERERNK